MTDRTDADAPVAADGQPVDPAAVRIAAPKDKPRSLWKELPVLVVIAVALALLIKTFFTQAFFIPSGSMEHTLEIGDRVLVNKLVYDFRNPRRGEVIVFNGDFVDPVTGGKFPPETTSTGTGNALAKGVRKVTGFLGLGSGDDSDFIKRVIGVGGDTVSCPASKANPNICDHVLVNGKAIDEVKYLNDGTNPGQEPFPARKVPQGRLFVMGDHRDDSDDSRPLSNTTNATVPIDKVVGRAFAVVWPAGRFGGLGVPSTFDQNLSAGAPSLGETLVFKAAGSAGLPPVAGTVLALPVVGARRALRRRKSRRALA